LSWFRDHKELDTALNFDALVQSYYGRFDYAKRLLQESRDFAKKQKSPPSFHFFELSLALESADVEDWAGAHRLLADSGPFNQSRSGQLWTAMAFAQSGDIAPAERIATMIDQQYPQDTLIQYYYLPTIRAAIQIKRHNAAGAIELLKPAEQYELANPDSFNNLYPAYIRGLAYLQLGEGHAASAEFQKMLDHPAIVGRHVTGALAHLQLGRAQVMMGDKAAARKSYQDFLTLWKNADPDIPIYKQAKAEYAHLQ
jgi:tetratricopeptide (TPR) repeat protein